MRHLQNGFGREKLCFLIASVAAACGAFYLLGTAPAPLRPDPPRSALLKSIERGENRFVEIRTPHGSEETYVSSGTDPETGRRINRDRANPFAPVRTYEALVASEIKPPAQIVLRAASRNTDPAPAEHSKQKSLVPLPPEFEFAGVATFQDDSIGLLRRKDGSGIIGVKAGSELKTGTATYRVEQLEKQGILLSRDAEPLRLDDRGATAPVQTPARKMERESYDF